MGISVRSLGLSVRLFLTLTLVPTPTPWYSMVANFVHTTRVHSVWFDIRLAYLILDSDPYPRCIPVLMGAGVGSTFIGLLVVFKAL